VSAGKALQLDAQLAGALRERGVTGAVVGEVVDRSGVRVTR
jgi:hypothetical protein